MCGILGIVANRKISERDWLEKATALIHHRGPDDCGSFYSDEGNVLFGHRRLSILDLSQDGHQPMKYDSGRLTIVFNGEIYNYLDLRSELIKKGYGFKSNSDTEVVLAAYHHWGTECTKQFNGMFALAIFDKLEQKVFFARDRVGEKPLFYSFSNGKLIFGSELKIILCHPDINAELNPNAFNNFLNEGYVAGSECLITGVNKLPPGHSMTFDLVTSKLNIWCYWSLPSFNDNTSHSEHELLENLEALLEDAVKKQLVADVPLGVLLSGGVDSSLITAMAAKAANKVKTFTISFPENPKYDEKKHARLIANHFGTDHTELEAEPSSVDLLPELAAQYDEPIMDSSMVPTFLVSRLIKKHCSVALGGDGGDELFGGYSHYNKLLWLEEKSKFFPRFMRIASSELFNRVLPVGHRARNWAKAFGTDYSKELPLVANYFDALHREKLVNLKGFSSEIRVNSWQERITENSNLLERATRTDFYNYLPEDILVKVDRASMLNSLEVRAPFLDYRIIEFAYSKIPSHLKATSNNKKILLKKLTSKLLPPEFDQKRKQGFNMPLSSWLVDGSWSQYFQEVLFDKDQNLFNHEYVNKLILGQRKGQNNGERLFGILMFTLWVKHYGVSI